MIPKENIVARNVLLKSRRQLLVTQQHSSPVKGLNFTTICGYKYQCFLESFLQRILCFKFKAASYSTGFGLVHGCLWNIGWQGVG